MAASTLISAAIVVEVVPGAAAALCERLAARGLVVAGVSGSRVAAVCEASSAAEIEAIARRLAAEDADVLGVFPTFLGTEFD